MKSYIYVFNQSTSLIKEQLRRPKCVHLSNNKWKMLKTTVILSILMLQGTLSVISSDPAPCKDGNAWFATIPFKALSDQVLIIKQCLMFMSHIFIFNFYIELSANYPERNWVFAPNSAFLITISLEPNVVDPKYFKLWYLLDQIFWVWNIKGLSHQVLKI